VGGQYEGNFQKDLKQGDGLEVNVNGDTYKGQFLNDKKHGKGLFTWANGNTYEGDWKDDMKEGKGTMRTLKTEEAAEAKYIGQWLKDLK
jgi:hypothetical protein